MDLNPAIVEISSDEDGGWDEHNDDNFDWLSELFDNVENQKEESDDVVIVDEVSCSPAIQKQTHNRLTDTTEPSSKDDLDDDCVVLDGDPENPIPVVNDSLDRSDELLIVGEKGQLACRDYPHSRHLCAKFPFSSSPHEKYCDLCHCYVCDLLAPCIHWGTGVSSTDHCHSTDKEEVWRVQRKNFKQGKTVAIPVTNIPDTTLSLTPGPHNTVPALALSETLNCHPVPLQPVSQPSSRFYACSSSTSFDVPNIISLKSQRSGLNLSRSRFPQHASSRSQPMPGTRYIMRKNRSGYVGTLGPQFVPQSTKFKRAGYMGGSLVMNQSGYGSSNNNNPAYMSQQLRNCNQVNTPIDSLHIRWQDILADGDLELNTYQSSSQPNMSSSSFAESQSYQVTSQPQVYCQPLPQQHDNQNSYLHENSASNAANLIPPDFNVGWTNSTGQSQQHPPAEGSQLQSVQSTYEPLLVTEADAQYPRNTNLCSPDYQLDSWIRSLENQPDPGAAKDSVPSELDFVSPQPALMDPSLLLYDLDSSWNGLGHV